MMLRPILLDVVFSLAAIWASGRQRFREVPESVAVPEGASVELRCAVDGQNGKAQWTKDGFALGFQRSVPGYPRYMYNGNSSLGEHHLTIVGIALEDDGEYQCQVGPTSEDTLIWIAANVTVLVAPSSIAIVGHEDGSEMRVTVQHSFVMECLIENSRPPSSVFWYRDGVQLNTSSQEDGVTTGNKPKLFNVRSRLRWFAVAEDDGHQYSCRGDHPALHATPTALVSTVTLSVLHPPKPPSISGYAGESLMVGNSLHLSCRSEGGNPAPNVSWYARGVLLDDTWTQEAGSVVNNITLGITSQEDNAIIECNTTNEVTPGALSSSFRLSVLYPPTDVRIEAPSFVSLGDLLKAECQSSQSNPVAEITWIIENRRISSALTSVERGRLGGWITTSKLLDFVVNEETSRDGSLLSVRCEARSPVNQSIASKEVRLNIVRPPGLPILDGLSEDVEKGSKLLVFCFSRGGTPPPELRLFKGRQILTSEEKKYENVTEVVAEVMVGESDNGRLVTCRLTHPAFEGPIEVAHQLNVIFAPTEVVITVDRPEVKLGERVVVMCESPASNPLQDLVWFSGDEVLAGHSRLIQEGGQYFVRGKVEFVAAIEDDGRNVTCSASNGLPPDAPDDPDGVRDTTTIRVLHPPMWLSLPPKRVSASEGEEFELRASASANPGPIRYEWSQNGRSTGSSGNILVFKNVSRSDAGLWVVTAATPSGSANSSIVVDVKYGPEILNIPDETRLPLGSTLFLNCSAGGSPPPRVAWISVRSGQILSSGVNSTILKIEEARVHHTQELLCSASNDEGARVTKRSKLVIQHGAMLLRNSGMSWVVKGQDAFVLCHGRAEPPPVFRWSSDTRSFERGTSYSYVDGPVLIDNLNLWTSFVKISNYRMNEEVRCAIQNGLGRDFSALRLTDQIQAAELKVIRITPPSVSFAFKVKEAALDFANTFSLVFLNLENLTIKERRVWLNASTFPVEGLIPGNSYVVSLYGSGPDGPISSILLSVLFSFWDATGNEVGLVEEQPGFSLSFGGMRAPRLALLVTTAGGMSLLLVNITLITCYLNAKKASIAKADKVAVEVQETDESPDEVYLPKEKSDSFLQDDSSTVALRDNEVITSLLDGEGSSTPRSEKSDNEEYEAPDQKEAILRGWDFPDGADHARPTCDGVDSESGGLDLPISNYNDAKTKVYDAMQTAEKSKCEDVESDYHNLTFFRTSPGNRRRLDDINDQWGTPSTKCYMDSLTENFQFSRTNLHHYFFPLQSYRDPFLENGGPASFHRHDGRDIYSEVENEAIYSPLNPVALYNVHPTCGPQCYLSSSSCPDCDSCAKEKLGFFPSLPRQRTSWEKKGFYDSCYFCQEELRNLDRFQVNDSSEFSEVPRKADLQLRQFNCEIDVKKISESNRAHPDINSLNYFF